MSLLFLALRKMINIAQLEETYQMLKLGTKWNQVRRVEMMLTGEKLTILPWCWKMLPRHSIAVLKRQKRRQDVAHMS